MSQPVPIDSPEYARLKAMWLEQRKPGQVLLGGDSYEVVTPNGDDAPVFIGSRNQDRYTSLSYSTGAFEEPKPDQPAQSTPGRGKKVK